MRYVVLYREPGEAETIPDTWSVVNDPKTGLAIEGDSAKAVIAEVNAKRKDLHREGEMFLFQQVCSLGE